MHTQKIFKLGLAALFTVSLAACSSSGDTDMDDSSMDDGANAAAAEAEQQLTAEQLREQEMLQTTVFYFDFDQSDLSSEAREALVYHANYLKANPSMNARLEGHTDERGTREYNLALGERRAQAVERYLQVQGVPSGQMETISYGEEMPAAVGTTESAYARNRRVELNY